MLILFFLWKNREQYSSIGWIPQSSGREALVGMTGAVPTIISLWRESLVIPVVIHFLQNLAAILLPLAGYQWQEGLLIF